MIDVINIVTLHDNLIEDIKHFPIADKNQYVDIVSKAEDEFIRTIESLTEKTFTEDEKANIISDGYFDLHDYNDTDMQATAFSVQFVWSVMEV